MFIASTENDEGGSGSDGEMAQEKEDEAEEAYSPSSIKPKSNFIFFFYLKRLKFAFNFCRKIEGYHVRCGRTW